MNENVERSSLASVVVLWGTLILLIVSLYGLSKIQVSSDNRVFFGKNNSYFSELIDFESRFSGYTTLVVMLDGNDHHPVDSPLHLEAHLLVVDRLKLLERVVKTESLFSFPAVFYSDSEISITSIGKALVDADMKYDSKGLLSSKGVVNRLVSGDKSISAVVAYFEFPIGTHVDPEKILNPLKHLLLDVLKDKYPQFVVYTTGGLPMMNAFKKAAEQDSIYLFPIAAFVLFFILYIVIGSSVLTTLLLGVGAASSLVTMAAATYSGLVFDSATSTLPLVVFSLVVAIGMHVFVHVVRGVEFHGSKNVGEAVKISIAHYKAPILLTSFTTIVGLCSLALVSSPPVRALGIWAAVGVFVGTFFLLYVLPEFIGKSLMVKRSWVVIRLQRLMNQYARSYTNPNKYSMWALVVMVLASLGLIRLSVNDDFVSYFDLTNEFRKGTEFSTKYLAGPYSLELVVGVRGGSILTPEYLAVLNDVETFVEDNSDVRNKLSLFYFLEESNKTVDRRSFEYETMSIDELEQLYLIWEMSLPTGAGSRDFIDSRRQSSRISVLLGDVEPIDIRILRNNMLSWFDAKYGSQKYSLSVTGESVPTAYLSFVNIKSMVLGIVASLLFSSLLVGAMFRCARLALVCFTSIVIPVTGGFGLWFWGAGEIGLAATVVIAVTIGIVVDDAIHMIYRAVDGIDNVGLTPIESASYSIYRIGTTMVLTTFVLVSCFSVLLFSDFGMNQIFGILSSIVLCLALIFDLMLLPKMLVWAISNRKVKVSG